MYVTARVKKYDKGIYAAYVVPKTSRKLAKLFYAQASGTVGNDLLLSL